MKQKQGMTLIELVVALIGFTFLILAVIALSSAALTTWHRTEYRKDISQRAGKIISQILSDFENVFIEHQEIFPLFPEGNLLSYFKLTSDEKNNQIVRFVKTKGYNPNPRRSVINKASAIDSYSELVEVCYFTEGTILWRGEKPFTRLPEDSFINQKNLKKDNIKRYFKQLDDGVLYLEFRPEFRQPGPCPDRVQIFMIIESKGLEYACTTLLSDISKTDNIIRLASTKFLPPAPNYVKIDDEFIEYSQVEGDVIKVKKRGAFKSKPSEHKQGSKVRYGEIFTFEIDIPIAGSP